MSSADVSIVDAPELANDPKAVRAPELTTTSVRLDRWTATCVGGDCDHQAVLACFSSSVGVWSPEVAELVHGKLDDTARNTAFRATGDGSMALAHASTEGDVMVHDLHGQGRDARTFLAFTPDVVHACFAVSVSPDEATDRDWVHHTHLRGPIVGAPETSVSIAALSACVHHPKHTLAGALALVAALSVAAIVRRPGRRRPEYSRRGA